MRSRASIIFSYAKQGFDPAQILNRLALRKALEGCDSVLDVGCGKSRALRELGIKRSVGIEGYAPDLEEARRLNTHDELILGDVRRLEDYFSPGQFDAVIAMDVIEHLVKDDGLRLMQGMEKIARRKVVLFTPSGFLPQRHLEKADLQEHLSGWEAAEMERYGYQVEGLLGPKKLRGEFHAIKGRPKIAWAVVSLIGHLFWTRWHPAKAAAIFCVKTK
ncbi:MAG TPA: class I SAM-dependent methyltransferase [Candidatus Sulfotelmatobacter sp.]|nr:class I SAM-dependent methyltransferase [Candidatus Sulfotelmatobacter sp.]